MAVFITYILTSTFLILCDKICDYKIIKMYYSVKEDFKLLIIMKMSLVPLDKRRNNPPFPHFKRKEQVGTPLQIIRHSYLSG